jgi:hypothetical protein
METKYEWLEPKPLIGMADPWVGNCSPDCGGSGTSLNRTPRLDYW